jgi:ubiquinone/menaquinone biosynthesis C-methylase UbiE
MQPGERLLISGVGTGLDLSAVPAGVDVTGVDISPDMLRQAARKPAQANVHLVEMDAQKLDPPSESFDAVLLSLIVSVAPDGQAVFSEAWRALKPGGRLVLFDKFVTGGQPISPLRRVVGSLIRALGTDVNRRLEDVLRCAERPEIEVHERMLFGQYHILKIKKGVLQNSLDRSRSG